MLRQYKWGRFLTAVTGCLTLGIGAGAGCSPSTPPVTPRPNLASSVSADAVLTPYNTAPAWKGQTVTLTLHNNGTQPLNEIWGIVHVYDAKGKELSSASGSPNGQEELLWVHHENWPMPQQQGTLGPHQAGKLPSVHTIMSSMNDGATGKTVKAVVTKAFEKDYVANGADDPQLQADHLGASPSSSPAQGK